MYEPFSVFLGSIGILYALLFPLLILQALSIIFIPSMIVHGAKPLQVGKAIYCYLLQMIGVLLLTLGSLPALYGVLANQNYDSKMYLALLIIFTAGGLTFLWHDNLLRNVDVHSRAVPEAVYRYTLKLIGYASVLISTLSLLIVMLLGSSTTAHWWVLPFLFLCYGILLSWCTRDDFKHSFQAYLLRDPPFRPTHPGLKATAKKKK